MIPACSDKREIVSGARVFDRDASADACSSRFPRGPMEFRSPACTIVTLTLPVERSKAQPP